jgi:hypothetical protein
MPPVMRHAVAVDAAGADNSSRRKSKLAAVHRM